MWDGLFESWFGFGYGFGFRARWTDWRVFGKRFVGVVLVLLLGPGLGLGHGQMGGGRWWTYCFDGGYGLVSCFGWFFDGIETRLSRFTVMRGEVLSGFGRELYTTFSETVLMELDNRGFLAVKRDKELHQVVLGSEQGHSEGALLDDQRRYQVALLFIDIHGR